MNFTGVASSATVTVMNPSMADRDPVDLDQAVRLHYRKVYHFALHLSRQPDDAADLTQYAYEQLARKQRQIADPGKVKGWLQTTVYRKFIDQRRRVIRFPKVEFDEESLPREQPEHRPGNRLDAQTALAALQDLDEDLRAPLSLFYLDSCSYREIAEILDLPVGTVMSRLYRGKQKLYQVLTSRSS